MRTHIRASTIALLLAAPAFAQGFTTPPGYLTTEGVNGYATYLGAFADQRYQVVDGELPAGTQILTSVGYRLDYRSHTTATAMGRSWSNVNLDLSNGDRATMTATFTTNQKSTPSRVFSGSVTWPSQTGNPLSQPAPWATELRFPFTGAYIHAGTTDLCQTYEFSGGVLANSGAWTTSTSKFYYLDGEYSIISVTFGRSVFKNIGTGTADCKDPGASATYAAGSVQVGLYSSRSTSYPNTAQLQAFGSGTAPSSLVIQGFGLAGSSPGVQIPAFDCYNLMIDTTQIGLYVRDTANTTGGRAFQYFKLGDLATLAPLGSSVSIWSQAAWDHSTSKKPALTTAERCTPNFAYPGLKETPKKKCTYYYDVTTAIGLGPYDTFSYLPIIRYN